jgi:hypothetical protein
MKFLAHQTKAPMNLYNVHSNIRFLSCDQMLFIDGNMHSTAADATGKEETNSVTCNGRACVSMCIIMTNSQMPVKVMEVQALETKAIATRLESWTVSSFFQF